MASSYVLTAPVKKRMESRWAITLMCEICSKELVPGDKMFSNRHARKGNRTRKFRHKFYHDECREKSRIGE